MSVSTILWPPARDYARVGESVRRSVKRPTTYFHPSVTTETALVGFRISCCSSLQQNARSLWSSRRITLHNPRSNRSSVQTVGYGGCRLATIIDSAISSLRQQITRPRWLMVSSKDETLFSLSVTTVCFSIVKTSQSWLSSHWTVFENTTITC